MTRVPERMARRLYGVDACSLCPPAMLPGMSFDRFLVAPAGLFAGFIGVGLLGMAVFDSSGLMKSVMAALGGLALLAVSLFLYRRTGRSVDPRSSARNN